MITPEQLLRPRPAESGSTLDRPLEHLTACHRRIEQRLETLERVAGHLEARHGEALEAMESCFRFFESNGVLHTTDEEESLFPRLQPGLSDEERTFIAGLESQHREADQLYTELKAIAVRLRGGQPVTAELHELYRATAARLSELYRSQIAAEDETLIALGERDLSDSQLVEISTEMKRRRALPA